MNTSWARPLSHRERIGSTAVANPIFRLSRRSLLLGAAGTAIVGACGGASASNSSTGNKTAAQGPATWLIPFFSTGEAEKPMLRTGVLQRMPFGLADPDGVPLSDVASKAQFTVSLDGNQVGDPVQVTRHSDGTPFPYYPLRITFTVPGAYQIRTVVGGKSLERTVVIAAPGEVDLIQPGEKAVPVVTPTTDDANGVAPICTRETPCPYHELPLSEALLNGKPTVFLISTPAYCQTNVCGPVLEMLIDAEPKMQAFNVIHAEVYADIGANDGDILRSTLTEAVRNYRLSFEPSLLLIDAKGVVVDRLDFVFDTKELDAALQALAAG